MTGKQDCCKLIEEATTFENALASALEVVNPMVFSHNNQLISLIVSEVKYIDEDFRKRQIGIYTFRSFYKAVLLLHSILIFFSDFTNKYHTFTEEASKIHFQIIKEIINLECEVERSGHSDFKEKDKYLNIWKKLLKDTIYLCSEYSSNRDASQSNVSNSNKNFLPKLRHFLKISLSWLKKILSTRISFKLQTASVAENGNHNQPQSPPPENSPGVSHDMIRIAITIIVLVIGITLALTVFR